MKRQLDLLQFLSNQKLKMATMQETREHLNLDFNKHPKGTKEHRRKKSQFYRIISPLLEWIIETDRGYYKLTKLLYNRKMKSIDRSITYLCTGK